MRKLLLKVLLCSAIAPLAAAQTTGTPVFLAPYKAFRSSEIAAYFSDPGPGWVIEGMLRMGRGGGDIGFRAGLGDNDIGQPNGPSSTYFVAGVDFRARIVKQSEGFPLDGALTLGVGGIFGDGFTEGRIPIGISLGRRVDLEGTRTSFVPYFQPILTPIFGDSNDDVLFGIGLGVDIKFSTSVDFRIGAGLGDYDGISLGISFTH